MWITSAVSVSIDRERFFYFLRITQRFTEDRWAELPGSGVWIRSSPLHQRLVLSRGDLQHLFYCTGPAETAELQPFVKEEKSVPFPDKPFDAVTLPSAEQKEDILFIWNQLEVEFYNGCRSVNPSP